MDDVLSDDEDGVSEAEEYSAEAVESALRTASMLLMRHTLLSPPTGRAFDENVTGSADEHNVGSCCSTRSTIAQIDCSSTARVNIAESTRRK